VLFRSGMALSDLPAPITTYEVHVVGNRVVDPAKGTDLYIAGMINIDQNGLNAGAGYINFIDYDLGEMRVGGLLNDPNCKANSANTMAGGTKCSGTRVRLNDPVGRYGRVSSPDVRFTVDPDNPTIISGTGYPMCFPRVSPSSATPDALCPEANRPRTADPVTGAIVPSINFTTNNLTNPNFPIPTTVDGSGNVIGAFPNSTFQAPLEVGDYISFAGNLVADCASCIGGGSIAGPFVPGTTTTFITAHTITNNTAVYTFQGSNPAYLMVDTSLIGTGGLTVLGAGEAVVRTRFEGMTTDISRNVHLYAMDWTSSGAESDRDYGFIGVDQGPAGGVGAVQGRWRFRPPCLVAGTIPTKPDKQCVMNQEGTFLPPPRELRAVIEGLQGQAAAQSAGSTAPGVTAANGIYWGQFHAPIDEYIFPENVPGTAIVENNFGVISFLSCGGYSSSGIDFTPTPPTLAPGPLDPWPSNIPANVTACSGFVAPPTGVTATATPLSVISGTGGLVTLSATASGTGPLTFTWAQAATDATQVTLTPAGNNATFTTPSVAASTTLNFTVTVSNSAGSATATVSVAVVVDTPIVNHVAPISVSTGTLGTLSITGTDPGGLPLTFSVVQTCTVPAGAVFIQPLTVTQQPPTGATATFNLALPTGAPAATLCFTITATNTAGVTSPAEFTTATVNPVADTITFTTAQYRTGKQRLDLSVTTSVVSPTVTMYLDSYLANDGTTVQGPIPLTNTGGGVYTLTAVGVKPPICRSVNGPLTTPCNYPAPPITVKTSIGGSASTELLNIRQ